MRTLSVRFFPVAVALVAVAAYVPAVPASAEIAPGCMAAVHANERAASYHAVLVGIAGQGATTTTDIQKPDRIHMIMGPIEIIAVGNKAWKRSRSGWQTYPSMPVAQILSMSNSPLAKKVGSCQDAGMGSWHGQPAHLFKGTTLEEGKPSVTTIYVFSDGFVHHIENTSPSGGFTGESLPRDAEARSDAVDRQANCVA